MSVVVFCLVFWQLRETGTAYEDSELSESGASILASETDASVQPEDIEEETAAPYEYVSKTDNNIEVKCTFADTFPSDLDMNVSDVEEEELKAVDYSELKDRSKILDEVGLNIAFNDSSGNEYIPDTAEKFGFTFKLPEDRKWVKGKHLLLRRNEDGGFDKINEFDLNETEISFESIYSKNFYVVTLSDVELPLEYSETSDSGIKVNVRAEEGAFPDNTTIKLTDIASDKAMELAGQGLNNEEIVDAVAVDISFFDSKGAEIEPVDGKRVEVSITLPEEQTLQGGDQILLHETTDGTVEAVEDAVVTENDAEFVAGSFSIYVLTSVGEKGIDEATKIRLNDSSVQNDASNRYIAYVGEEFYVITNAIHGTAADHNWNYAHFSVSGNGTAPNNKLERMKDGDKYIDDGQDQQGEKFKLKAYYKAKTPGDCEIVLGGSGVTSETFYVRVMEKPELEENMLYIETVQGVKVHNLETYNLLNGGGDITKPYFPYYRYVGDEFEVSIYVKNSIANPDRFRFENADGHIFEKVSGSEKVESVPGRDDLKKVSVKYRAVSAGGSSGQSSKLLYNIGAAQTDDNPHAFYRILEPVYVKTTLGNKNIDMVNEWLEGFGFPKRNGYVPNSEEHEYVMEEDYTVTLCGDYPDVSFTKTSDCLEEIPIPPEEQIPGKSMVRYRAVKPGEKIRVDYGDKRAVFFEIREAGSGWYNHADIEISDGGKYSHTTVTYDAVNHQKIITVKVYDSYITKVNGCYLYDENGDVIIPKNQVGDDQSFRTDDYYQNGVAGQPQYELTSQYKIVDEQRILSNKNYQVSDVKSALFDVALTLKPSYQFVITQPDSGPETIGPQQPLGGDDVIIDSNLFYMDKQDVEDAFNKCPNHSGLDFTIHASMALTQMEALKTLRGGSLTGDDFEFEILDESGTAVASAFNTSDGDILFDNLHFESEGIYDYTLKEVIPEVQGNIQYDTSEFNLHITVREIDQFGQKIMTAEIELDDSTNYEFVNKTKYTLPNTGGSGAKFFWIAGLGIIFAGACTFVYKNKKNIHYLNKRG